MKKSCRLKVSELKNFVHIQTINNIKQRTTTLEYPRIKETHSRDQNHNY